MVDGRVSVYKNRNREAKKVRKREKKGEKKSQWTKLTQFSTNILFTYGALEVPFYDYFRYST